MNRRTGVLEPLSDRTRGPALSALGVAVVGAVVVLFVDFGALAHHMAAHIALMNIAAPLVAVALRKAYPAAVQPARSRLWLATLGQMALLWIWHSPAVYSAAQVSIFVTVGLHAALFLSALAFWIVIIDSFAAEWEAILALLVSGKLACLLGALLVFSPRLLFETSTLHHGGHGVTPTAEAALADQHLAGLLMITACPLSFVLTAIVLAAQAVSNLRAVPNRAFADSPSIGR